MLRVVLDTNVLVSALLKPDSLPELVVSLILGKRVRLCLSHPIFTEYQEVLGRKKFQKLDPEKDKATAGTPQRPGPVGDAQGSFGNH